jgi:hypothetical protein
MFVVLLSVTLGTSIVVTLLAFRLFDAPLRSILRRIVSDDLVTPWHRYVRFATYVQGVAGGVRLYELDQLLAPRAPGAGAVNLTPELWTLEVYKTVIGTLQSISWALMLVFTFALLAFVTMRGFETRIKRPEA